MTNSSPSPDEVRAALDQVLASSQFRDAGRLGPFLRHLVERTLAGDDASLKESLLGTEFFQRGADYDPRTDPVVRVEARRLRARLDEYYAGNPRANRTRITLPKGGYVPAFESLALGSGDEIAKIEQPARNWVRFAGTGVVVLASVAALWWQFSGSKPSGPAAVPAVVVLPLENVGGNPENDYFAEGLTEEMIDRLSRLKGLRVVARGVSASLKGKGLDLREAASRVNANLAVEGSIRRQGDRLRVAARLVDAAGGSTLWSQTYERELKDVFAIQDEIAQSVASALRLRVPQGNAASLPSRYTSNLAAYTAYLKGRHQFNLYSETGMRRAIMYYNEALQAQPDYAPAVAQLSHTYALLAYYNSLPKGVELSEAKRLAEKAISLDPGLAEAHAALGMVLAFQDWNWTAAEAELKKAQEVDPSSAYGHGSYGAAVLLPQGRLDEARTELKIALDMDPLSSFFNFVYGFALLASGQTGEAIGQYRKTLELENVHPDMEWDYGMALGFAGRPAEAADAFRRAHALDGNAGRELGGLEAYFAGDAAKARRDAPQLEAAFRRGAAGVDRMDLVRLYAMLGENGKALDWLEQAVDAREPQVIWMKVDPRLRSLQSEPRLHALARRINLEPPVR